MATRTTRLVPDPHRSAGPPATGNHGQSAFQGRGAQQGFEGELREMVRTATRRMEALEASSDSAGASVPGSPRRGAGDARNVGRHIESDSTPQGSDAEDALSDDFDGHRKIRLSHVAFRKQAAQYKTDLRMTKEAFASDNALLREKLDGARHRQLMLEQKMDALEAGHREQIRAIHARTQGDLEALQQRLHVMESQTPTHRQLMHKVRSAIDGAGVISSDQQYSTLLELPHSELQPEQLAAIKLYEVALPYRQRIETQQRLVDQLSKQKSSLEVEVAVATERADHVTAEKLEVEATLAKVRTEDHRMAHLDEVKRHLEAASRESDSLREKCAELESRLIVVDEARKDSETSAADALQRLEILQLDKEHLSRTNADFQATIDHIREQLREAQTNQRDVAKSREEAYERLLHAKSELTAESERVIQAQVAEIRDKTAAEMIELRSSARQMYEQEARGYRNERDAAVAERRQLEVTLTELTERYESLNSSYHELQMTSESRASDLSTKLRLKSFECERLNLLHTEAQTALASANLEVQKQQEKVAVATREYLELKATSNARIAVLETQSGGDRATLDAYEKLERELDEVVMQAADARDPSEMLLGYGRHIPGTAKRRLKQGVMLARKLLAAQRELQRSKDDVSGLENKVAELEEELNRSNELLTNVRTQPQQVLVEDLRQRDKSTKELRRQLNDLTSKAARLEAENVELLQVQNAMSADLERLLDCDAEIQELRNVIAKLQTDKQHPANSHSQRRPFIAVSRAGKR